VRAGGQAGAVKPRAWQVVVLVVALCFLSGVVGWLIGRPSDEQFSDVDIGFLSDMQYHHGGAVGLAFAYLTDQHDSLISQMAREIVVDQSQEITTMNNYLDDAGAENDPKVNDNVAMDWMGLPVPKDRMPGMPTAAETADLRAATGLARDDRFTSLMIEHHAAGAGMADYEAAHGENDAVKRLATNMAKLQRSEIAEMNTRRKVLGLEPINAAALEQLHSHSN
jgi:uncharacterized protein (DUF305 family)